jgi:hypothetical protein
MTAYINNRPADAAVAAAAAASAAHEAAAIHAQYHPQEAMLGSFGPHGVQYGGGHHPDPRDFFGAPNGIYYPPPQAPRLTAAAARASHFAAMYYDPTLHPQHAYSSNTSAPWLAPAYVDFHQPMGATEYIPAPTVQHQDLEQQLIRQNQLSRMSGQQPIHHDHRGHSRHPSYDPHAVGGPANFSAAQGGYVPAAHAPANEQQWGYWKPWNGQYNGSAGMPRTSNVLSATQPTSPAEYVPHARNDIMRMSAPSTDVHPGARQEYNGLGQAWRNEAARPVWNPAQWNKSLHSHAQRSLSQDNTGANWLPQPRQEPTWDAWHGQNPAQRNGAEAAWHEHQSYVPQPIGKTYAGGHWASEMSVPYVPHKQSQDYASGYHASQQSQNLHQALREPQRNDDAPAPHWQQQQNQQAQAAQQNVPSAPAPPSPGTLDKSAVPLTALGAEIVWIAAAAMLDCSLLQIFKRHSSIIQHPSSGRISAESSPSTSPSARSAQVWQRNGDNEYAHSSSLTSDVETLRAEHMEDSSASSSEPSTPPSANGSVRTQKSAKAGYSSPGSGPLIPMDALPGAVRPRPFYRSASHDKSKDAVAGIADLINHAWRWSTNDDKLASLHMNVRSSPLHSRQSSPMSRQATSPREEGIGGGHAGIPISGTDPSPAFRRFANQVLAQTLVSPTAFMLSLLYALRVLQLSFVEDGSSEGGLDQEAIEIFAQPPSAAPFKLFTLGLMIANKHLDDNTFLNKTWNEVTGITLPELNRMERWYLEKCSYEITVPEATWAQFLERLRSRNEMRLNAIRGVHASRPSPLSALPLGNRSTGSLEAAHRQERLQDNKSHASIMRPYRSGSGSGATPSSGSAASSAVTEEAVQRFLSDTEEALQAIGHLPPFDLGGLNTW